MTPRRICVSRKWKDRHPLRDGLGARGAPGVVAGPLLEGTVYLANLTFSGAGGPWQIPASDLAVGEQYLQRIAGPVAAYASQYGPARLAVGATLPSVPVSVANAQYSDRDLQGWIDSLVRSAALPPNSAVVVLNPEGLVNTDARESGGVGVLGYHGLASVPYAFVNSLGTGFTPDDTRDLYAEAVSHELAEMTVDPRADSSNPEVCDGCGTNCQGASAYRAYFDGRGAYLGTEAAFPPPYSYAFFLSAVARPASATACPAPPSACAYPPP